MATDLSKGSNILISISAQDILTIRLNWTVPNGYELDASAFMLNNSGKVSNDAAMIFFNQPQSVDNTVQFDANKKTFTVNLKKLNSTIQKIAFTLAIHAEGIARQHSLKNLNQAAISVTKDGQELARYDLLVTELNQETALVFAELYSHKGQWKFKAIGQGFNGGLPALCRHFGVEVAEETSRKTDSNSIKTRLNSAFQGMSFKKAMLIGGGVFAGILLLWLMFFFHKIYKTVNHVSEIAHVAEFVVKEVKKAPQQWNPTSFSTPRAAINQASSYPLPLENYINDFVPVLTAADAALLRQQLKSLEQKTGIEGTVVTVNSIGDYQTGDSSIESFTTHLFNYWGVGNLPENNGFMVLVAVKDRKCRIELGKDYGDQHSKRAKAIIDKLMIPLFKEGNYSGGVYGGTTSVIEMLTGRAEESSWFNSSVVSKAKENSTLMSVLFGGLLSVLAIFAVWTHRQHITKKHCGIASLLGLSLCYFFNYVVIALIIAAVIGVIYSLFNSDGRVSFDNSNDNDWESSDSSSDSFGGGDSSGDGASGDW